jgi:hypothetical protein
MIITLAVSPHGVKPNSFFLLRVSIADKQYIPRQLKFLLTGSNNEPIAVNLGGAFDNMGGISDPAINEWVMKNNYHVYPHGNPTKLKFKLLHSWLVFIEKD